MCLNQHVSCPQNFTGFWIDPIFQPLLSSLGFVFLRERLHLCHRAAVQFGGSLPELVCCGVEGWMLGGCTMFSRQTGVVQVVLQELP